MKKFIVIVAALFVAVSAHAQFGVIAGITSSRGDLKSAIEDFKTQNITQYHVGLTYKADLGLFAIQPSIIYNMKGTKLAAVTAAGKVSENDLDLKTGYVEIPVQLQAGLNLSIVRIYGFVEPFIGYAVTNSISLAGKNLADGWDDVKSRLEYGVSVGAGVELIKHVQVSVKYFWNLGDMYGIDLNKYINGLGSIANQKASGIAASVALLF